VKTYFNADINDALLYHLVINTSRVGCENAARIIGDALLRLGQVELPSAGIPERSEIRFSA
jgi:cytidylate kinase